MEEIRTLKVPVAVHQKVAGLAEEEGLTMKQAAIRFFGPLVDQSPGDGPEPEDWAPEDVVEDEYPHRDDGLLAEVRERFDRLEAQHAVLEHEHAGLLAGQQSNAEALGNGTKWVRDVRDAARRRGLPPDMQSVIAALPGADEED